MRYHWYMALKGLKINKVRIEGTGNLQSRKMFTFRNEE